MKKRAILIYMFSLILILALSLSAGAEKLQTYVNGRFGFIVKIPANWKMVESQNRDGITITPPLEKDVEIRIFGGYNIMDNTMLDEAHERELKHYNPLKVAGLDGLLGDVPGGRAVFLQRKVGGMKIYYYVYLFAPKKKIGKYYSYFERIYLSFKPVKSLH